MPSRRLRRLDKPLIIAMLQTFLPYITVIQILNVDIVGNFRY